MILGCTRGAGQTITALMTGHILAAVRGVPVAALDLNPGDGSLTSRRSAAGTVAALLAGEELAGPGNAGPGNAGPGNVARPDRGDRGNRSARLDVITGPAHPIESGDYQRLAALLAERYPLTLVDPAPAGLPRTLSAADQLVLVVPASPDAASSLANTQQWLGAHGYAELAARAVTVLNGVSRRTSEDVAQAEAVARGRGRAIVRVPWDDLLTARPGTPAAVNPQTRVAYAALAGVLITGLADAAADADRDADTDASGRNPGEHAD